MTRGRDMALEVNRERQWDQEGGRHKTSKEKCKEKSVEKEIREKN